MTTRIVATRLRPVQAITVLVAIVAATVLGLVLAGRAGASPVYPPHVTCGVSASNSTPTVGDSITISGSGYAVGETVTLQGNGVTLGTPKADSAGSFQLSATVPAALAGVHRVSGSSPSCSNAGFEVDALTIEQAAVTDPRTSTGSSGLASTGFQAVVAGTVAVLLLGGGTLLVLAGRRRRLQ